MIIIDQKKYYYLKLKENFFDSDEMIVLENMPDGYLYSNILLKLYLRSLKNEGKLMFNDRIPFNATMLAQVTRHNVGVIEKAMKIFKELGLIDILDNGAIYLLDIQNFIGRSSTEADRIRKYRNQIETEKGNVQMLQQKSENCTPELENKERVKKEKSKSDTEAQKNSPNSKNPHGTYKNVMLTDEELEDIKTKGFEYLIDRLSEYMKSKGKEYADHYVTLLSFAKREDKSNATSKGKVVEYDEKRWGKIIG